MKIIFLAVWYVFSYFGAFLIGFEWGRVEYKIGTIKTAIGFILTLFAWWGLNGLMNNLIYNL